MNSPQSPAKVSDEHADDAIERISQTNRNTQRGCRVCFTEMKIGDWQQFSRAPTEKFSSVAQAVQ
jgi:hypothetical protein